MRFQAAEREMYHGPKFGLRDRKKETARSANNELSSLFWSLVSVRDRTFVFSLKPGKVMLRTYEEEEWDKPPLRIYWVLKLSHCMIWRSEWLDHNWHFHSASNTKTERNEKVRLALFAMERGNNLPFWTLSRIHIPKQPNWEQFGPRQILRRSKSNCSKL